jgi:hypothetical protein
VKDPAYIEEALKLVSSFFLIGSNLSQIQILLHNSQQGQVLSNEELFILHHLFFDITVGTTMRTFEQKIAYFAQELGKLVTSDNN